MRAVFDTNVVVSALLFGNRSLARLRRVWSSRTVVPVVSGQTVRELMRVLHYPRFRLGEKDRHDLLGQYLPFTEDWPHPLNPCGVDCGDPDDQVFLDLATDAGVDAIVSGDRHVKSVAGILAVPILEPADLLRQIGQTTHE